MLHVYMVDQYGEINVTLIVPDLDHVDANTPPGMTAIHMDPPTETARWGVNGWVERPSQPAPHLKWDSQSATWIDGRELTVEKIKKLAATKAARDATEYGGFTWGGYPFDSNLASQSRIQGAAQMALLAMQNNTPFSIDWTLQDNTSITLSGSDLIGVGQSMGAHIIAAHTTYRALKELINEATIIAELDAISWPE